MVSKPRRTAILLGFAGIVLILLGVKSLLSLGPAAPQKIEVQDQPSLLLFNVMDGCECMMELAHSAEAQVAGWEAPKAAHIQVITIDFDEQKELVQQYDVFRAPTLILIDAQGKIAHRQDYPQTEGGPFDLQEFERVIASMQ